MMKRRSFLKGLLAIPPIIGGCKVATVPTDKLLRRKSVHGTLTATEIQRRNAEWVPQGNRILTPDEVIREALVLFHKNRII